jgi:hypothetical protein
MIPINCLYNQQLCVTWACAVMLILSSSAEEEFTGFCFSVELSPHIQEIREIVGIGLCSRRVKMSVRPLEI